MDIMLAENIRRLRKERSLTQEQLAEVLGVTTGAVYKWEARLSMPELNLIMELADFFDTSVDVLLGYEMKDNRLEATVRRLRECRKAKDSTGLREAEKALKKYPHSFKIVYECAALYRGFGFEFRNESYIRRSLELLEQSLTLLAQNTDPEISEQTIYGKIAQAYMGLNEQEKGVELLKKHNAGGLFNPKIGSALADFDNYEDATPFLSEALLIMFSNLTETVIGYTKVYIRRGDYASAEAILKLGIGFLKGLCRHGKPSILDKINCCLLSTAAYTQLMAGRDGEARATIKEAVQLARFFDASPSYNESDIRFIDSIEGASTHDNMGATAMDVVNNVVDGLESEKLSAFLKAAAEGDQGSLQ